MTKFTVYDATGQILRSGSVPDDMVDIQAQEGEFILREIEACSDKQYVVNGQVHDFTQTELQTKRSMPKGWIWKLPEKIAVDTRSLEEIRKAKAEEVNQACHAQILAGFTSNALDASHLYPTKPQDQANLLAAVTDAMLNSVGDHNWTTLLWCADVHGLWDMRSHTAAQIKQVFKDSKAAILDAQITNAGLQKQILKSKDTELRVIKYPTHQK